MLFPRVSNNKAILLKYFKQSKSNKGTTLQLENKIITDQLKNYLWSFKREPAFPSGPGCSRWPAALSPAGLPRRSTSEWSSAASGGSPWLSPRRSSRWWSSSCWFPRSRSPCWLNFCTASPSLLVLIRQHARLKLKVVSVSFAMLKDKFNLFFRSLVFSLCYLLSHLRNNKREREIARMHVQAIPQTSSRHRTWKSSQRKEDKHKRKTRNEDCSFGDVLAGRQQQTRWRLPRTCINAAVKF